MKAISIPYKTENKLDFIKVYVQIIAALKGMKLSDTDVLVIARFILDGYNDITKESLVTNKIRKNMQGVNNMLSDLRKLGVLVRNNLKQEELAPEFNLTNLFNAVNELELRIKLDNK